MTGESSDKTGHVVLCPNPHRDTGLELTLKALKLLEESGFRTVISPVFNMEIEPGIKTMPLTESTQGAALLITFGGDGTILHAARSVMERPLPILGVNLGKKGFMAALMPGELERVVEASRGNFTVDRRMMLEVSLIRGGKVEFRDNALNDAAVTGFARMIHLRAYCDGKLMTDFSGDGIVAATPTGSTAYSMSAGGPIVEPSARNIILTPICAHDLAARSIVLAPERVVSLEWGDTAGRRAVLSVDGGGAVDIHSGDLLQIRRSEYETQLAHLEGQSFFEDLRRSLSGVTPS